jgi:hypothetical protein
MRMINDTKVFDRRDNTFTLSNRKAATRLGVGSSTVDRLFRALSANDLVRDVRNQSYTKEGVYNTETVAMLSPLYIFISYTKSDRWITGALWELRDIEKVYNWSTMCKELACFIHPCSGEVKPFNWYEIDCKANQYTSFDRCYRKGSKEKYYNDDQHKTEYYSLKDADTDSLTPDDQQWLDSVNQCSDLRYKKFSRKVK